MDAAQKLKLYDALADGQASIFDEAYEGHRDDKDFIYAAAIAGDEEATQDFFSNMEYSHLTEDRDFMKRVLSNNPYAIHVLSPEIAEDKSFIIQVLDQATSSEADYICEHLSDSHLRDKDVALSAVTTYGRCLGSFDECIKADKEVALQAVSTNGVALQCVDYRLKDDKDVVLAAVKSDSYAIDYASPRLKSLCKDKDPVQAIEAMMNMEKMQAELKPKPQQQKRGLKI